MQYQYLEKSEIRRLAMDIADGKVFASWMLRDGLADSSFGMVFMPVLLGGPPFSEEALEADPRFPKGMNTPCAFYEYYDKAGPRAINGYPIFFSCSTLLGKDVKRVRKLAYKFHRAKESMVAGL